MNGFKDAYDRWRYTNTNEGGADRKTGISETGENNPSSSQRCWNDVPAMLAKADLGDLFDQIKSNQKYVAESLPD